MARSLSRQRGLSLIGMIFVTSILVVVGILAMKVVPEVIEYYRINQAIHSTVKSVEGSASVPDIRRAYERRQIVEQISSVTSQDLEITKDGSRITIAFAYTKKIPLFGPVSLDIDFEGSTDK
jgi:hypothetical protein